MVYDQRDFYSAPRGPFAEVSPPPAMPMSPPAHVRPQFYGEAPPTNGGDRYSRRRASTSAVAGVGLTARRGGFPTLHLTESHAEQLRAIESKLLGQYLERYEAFVEVQQRTVDTGFWKLVRQANGVKAYKRRGASASRRSSLASLRARGALRGRAATMANVTGSSSASDDPMLLVVGSIEGTLEDVLYGALWHSSDERSTRTYYTKDGITDASVLATLERPSPMHPFRSLAVKWTLKRSLMKSATVIKDRDFVFLGATGTVRSRVMDERIGFELRHSLTLPSCPPLSGAGASIVRAEIMSCSFFRQMRGGRVEVFHQASFDAGGDLLGVFAWNTAIDNYISFASIVECSYIKKLVRAVQWSSENPPVVRPDEQDDPQAQPWDPEEKRCGVCGNPGRSLQRKCAICHLWVCSNCSAKKEIFTPLPGRPLVARCFCKTCLHKVQREDPTKYVLRELEQFEHKTATEYAHPRSPEIAVLEPRNGEMMPPPPPPSEMSEPVFFAIDASPLPPGGPPPRSSETVMTPLSPPPPSPPPPTVRRRQGSIPIPPLQPHSMAVSPAPPRYSDRMAKSQRKRFVSNDENSILNSARGRDHDRNLAGVGRSRYPSADDASTRATYAGTRVKTNPRGDIVLRSDAAREKWQHPEPMQQPMGYSVLSDEEMPTDRHRRRHRQSEIVMRSNGGGGTPAHRRQTMLGSEAAMPRPPPQPELASHRYHGEPLATSMRSTDCIASEQNVPISDVSSDEGRSLTSQDLGIHQSPSHQSPETGRDIPLPMPPVPRHAAADSTKASAPPTRARGHSRARDIYAQLRAARSENDPTTANEQVGAQTQQRFYSQYEELVPRNATALGEGPLLERRPAALLPSPEPQALTSRRSQQQENQSPPKPHLPLTPPKHPPPSRAPAPRRPDGPMQVRLSLLDEHEHEQLQRESQVLKQQQQLWMDREHDKHEHARRHDRNSQRRYDPPPPPPLQSNQATHNANHTGHAPLSADPASSREPTAREKDDLAVNTLLAELCEIARRTTDYTQSAHSSLAAASSFPAAPHDAQS